MSERILPDWLGLDQEKIVWLDDNHAVRWTPSKDDRQPTSGVLLHRIENDIWCYGTFFLSSENNLPGSMVWELVSKEPLTLSPSFMCHCGHSHGFIREGLWVEV